MFGKKKDEIKTSNIFIRQQCSNMVLMMENFRNAVTLSAQQDDGIISRDEQVTIKTINEACDEFIAELNKVIGCSMKCSNS